MTLPVVIERDNLVPGFMHASNAPAGIGAVTTQGAIFVNVISQVNDQIDLVIVGDHFIRVKPAEGVVRTGGDRQYESIKMANGQSFSLSQW